MKNLLIAFLLAVTGSCYADDVTEKLNQLRAEKENQRAVFREQCEARNTQNVKNVVQAIVKHRMSKDEFVTIYGEFDMGDVLLDMVWLKVNQQLRIFTIRSAAQWRNDALAKIDLIEAESVKAVIDYCVWFHVQNTKQFAD